MRLTTERRRINNFIIRVYSRETIKYANCETETLKINGVETECLIHRLKPGELDSCSESDYSDEYYVEEDEEYQKHCQLNGCINEEIWD